MTFNILHKYHSALAERLANIALVLPLMAVAALLALAPPPIAQAQPQQPQQQQVVEEDEDDESIEEIVVTGSRIRRSEFTSASPVQLISGEISRDAGLISVTDILQSSAQSTGTQIDSTFNGFVLDGGPGSNNINLRGLGAGRTLVLVDHKRLSPLGIGGAPSAPDTSLIPSLMLDRVELLLDGASSVYGSDAVAGVVNVILRKDFDGLDLSINTAHPLYGGGEGTVANVSWGHVGDNYSFGVAAEYNDLSPVKLSERPFTESCESSIIEDASGAVRPGVWSGLGPGATLSDCDLVTINRVNIQQGIGNLAWSGNVWYTPGRTNIAIPNWSETGSASNFGGSRADRSEGASGYNGVDTNIKNNFLRATDIMPAAYNCITGRNDNFCRDANGNPIPFGFRVRLDAEGDPILVNGSPILIPGQTIPTDPINPIDWYVLGTDGIVDVDIQDKFYNANGSKRDRDEYLFSALQRSSIYTYGEYEFGDDASTAISADVLYSRRETQVDNGIVTFFPDVPQDNPYNPCNSDTSQNPDGVDCSAFFAIPSFLRGKSFVRPIVSVRGDRDYIDASLEFLRTTMSLTGNILSVQGNWKYEVWLSYSTSEGEEVRRGFMEPRVELALHTSVRNPVTGEVSCGDLANWYGAIDTRQEVQTEMASRGLDTVDPGCRPLNLLTPDVLQEGGGNISDEDKAWLFGNRTALTKFKQSLGGLVLQGDLGTLPWNGAPVKTVLGYEHRTDDINTVTNDVAALGLLWGFTADRGAIGSRYLNEVFLETEADLLIDRPWAEQMTLNLSTRYTEESSFGDDVTYSVKGTWRPVSWLTLRSTLGTSFRAPNTREQFLVGVSGFLALNDRCVVPLAARGPAGLTSPPTYFSNFDTRLTASETIEGTDDLAIEVRCREALAEANVARRALGLPDLTFQNLGLDPTGPRTGTQPVRSTEVFSIGGSQTAGVNLLPETSVASTVGFVLDQEIWDDFNFQIAVSLIDVEIENSINRISYQGTIDTCYYGGRESDARFCDLIRRDHNGLISYVEQSYINASSETVTAVDMDILYDQSFVVADRALDLEIEANIVYTKEQSVQFSGFDPTFLHADYDTPRLEGNIRIAAEYNSYRFQLFSRYIKGEDADPNTTFTDNATACSDTLLQCRWWDSLPDYWVHNASVRYDSSQNWSLVFGVNNIFNTPPPLLDSAAAATTFSNIPLGVGYDLSGRTAVISFQKSFD